MRFKLQFPPFLVLAVLFFSSCAFSQVVPSAQRRSLPLELGGGISSFDVDWGHGRMLGGTLWGDWYPEQLPAFLHGLGIEAEARDISFNRGTHPSNFREDTGGGGPIYTWRHYQNFQPYVKYLIEFGSIDFRISSIPTYTHDTRQVYSPGIGFEYHVFKGVWARADYEYQFWPNLFGQTLNPQGFTFGATYRFFR